MGGNRTSAVAFSRKTVPKATDMSCDFASMAGPTAAMALPPQMAVPTLTSVEVSRGVPKSRPRIQPSPRVSVMPTTV